jgi:hypothetical protein
MEYLSADVLPILLISLFFRISRYRANKKSKFIKTYLVNIITYFIPTIYSFPRYFLE